MTTKKFLIKFIESLTFLLMFSLLFFGRSFSGIYFFGYRLGEFIALFGLIIYLLFLFSFKILKNLDLKNIYIIHTILVFLFILSFTLSNENLSNTYIFRASLFIWIVSFFYFGRTIDTKFENNIKYIYFINAAVFLNYIFTVVHFPTQFVEFFQNYSDKFDFNKAHMTVAFYVIVTFANYLYSKINFDKKINNLILFSIISGLYFPIFIFKSRGAFLGALIYALYYLYLVKNEIFENKNLLTYFVFYTFLYFFILCFRLKYTRRSRCRCCYRNISKQRYFSNLSFFVCSRLKTFFNRWKYKLEIANLARCINPSL